MPGKGNALKTGEFLGPDEYLVSNNGLFFAKMQTDGNFCIYKGSPTVNPGLMWGSVQTAGYPPATGDYFILMQSDGNLACYKGKAPPPRPGPEFFVWGTVQVGGYPPAEGQYTAAMQDDGNFCIYKAGVAQAIWATMVTDPVSNVEIETIDYNLPEAKILSTASPTIDFIEEKNTGAGTLTATITRSESVAEMSGWSDALQIKVGVSTTFKTGIPFVFEGKVTVSAEVNNTFTWNGSTTRTKTYTFTATLTLPPHTAAAVAVSITKSTIAVPYTLSGVFVLRSGARIPGSISGIYNGTNSYNLEVVSYPIGERAAIPVEATVT